jgi:RNA polymerase sigma factor (sigma-70 family)
MAKTPLETVLENLRRSVFRPEEAGLTDGDLLEWFITRRDTAAFEVLVRRHGPMVLGVCRRVLRNEADAEDAFQATFLVLIRKAASIRPRAMVGNWLYGVAQSTALKARAMSAKRLAKEREAAARAAPADSAETWERLHALLDQELKTLPDKYRAAIVLCDLEGKTIKEAAGHLGCPPGTVGTRLARGRRLLARRLSRHGLAVSGGGIAALIAPQEATARVPAPLLHSTVEAAMRFAAGRAVAPGVLPTRVLALTKGALTSMLLTKLKITTVAGLAVCALAVGAGLASYRALAANGPPPPAAPPPGAAAARSPAGTPPRPGAAESAPADKEVHGSGNVITRELSLADFTAVTVSRTFQVELTRADAFRVAITTDDNLVPHIQARKAGSTLELSVAQGVSFWATSLKATIAMPALDELRVASAARVTMKGFKSHKPFQATLGYSSTLEGEIEAPSVNLEVSGGGRVTLKGRAGELKIAAKTSRLSLADLAVDSADITLRDAATATVNAKDKLTYDLSRASRLRYVGQPAATSGKTSEASLVVPATSAPEPEKETGQPDAPHHHQHGAGAAPVPVAVGARVPDFALRDLEGKALTLSDLEKDARRTKKGALVLCFWCSTCSSCRRVEQHLDQLAKDYQGQALVLALDANAGETPEHVRAFAGMKGLTLPIVLNPDGRAADLFGTEVTTTTVVLDGDGVLRYCGRFRGGDGRPYAEDALKAVLAGKEVAVKTTPHDG